MRFLRHNSGVTLLEMAVSIALFSISITIVTGALTVGTGLTQQAGDQTGASTVGTSQLEDTLSKTYVEPADYSTITETGGLTITFNNFVISPTLLERITVIVSDTDGVELLNVSTHKVNDAFLAGPPALQFSQRDFQWFENTGDLTPITSLAAENSSFTVRELSQVYRLRMSVQLPQLPLTTADQAFKLQYAPTSGGPWTDVGAAGSGTTWRGFDNPSVADGATLPSLKLTLSGVVESYEEENPSVANPNAITTGDVGEWDWVIEENSAPFNTTFFFRMVQDDGTAFLSYTRLASIVMPPPLTLDQFDYQWFENVDSVDPTSPAATVRTPFTATVHGRPYRIRMNVGVDGLNLNTGDQAFELQYATSTGGPWTDVGTSDSTETWRFFDNPSVADGATIGTLKLSTSNIAESYQESNPSVANPTAIEVPDRGEWDWSIQDNSTADSTTYFFRMVKSGDVALDTYTRYPEFTTAPAPVLTQQDYRWYSNIDSVTPTTGLAAENTATTGATPTTIFRLRMNVGVGTANLTGDRQAFKLQFATSTGGAWTDLGAAGSGVAWRFFDNPTPTDGSTLPSVLLSSSEVAESYQESNPSPLNPNPIDTGDEGEWDWVVQSNTAVAGTFFFRMVKDDGTPLDTYVNFPAISTAAPVLTQQDYRWYANIDALTPTTSLAGENTLVTGATPLTVFRLRMNIDVSSIDLPTTTQAFKLQFATSTGGSWTDVGAISSVSPWRFFDNASVADGTTLTSLLLAASDEAGSYQESNPSVSNPNPISASEQAEWDWVLEDNTAPTDTYFFRMVRDDGTALDGYTNYP